MDKTWIHHYTPTERQWKLTNLSVKKQITDSISENLTDSDLESSIG